MHISRASLAPLLTLALIFSTCLLISGSHQPARAQQQQSSTAAAPDDYARGVQLYQQGDTKGAIKALRAAVKRQKENADAWYYLGLALNRDGDAKAARKAFEMAVKLRPDSANAHAALAYMLLLTNKSSDALREAERALAINAQNAEAHYVISVVRLREGSPSQALEEVEAALKLKPDFPLAFLLKSQALIGVYAKRIRGSSRLLKEAADSLESYIRLNPSAPDIDFWRGQLATLRVYAQNGGQDSWKTESNIFAGSEVTTRARLVSRPEPTYTESARRAMVSGTVVLRAIFDADGTVKHILVLQSLPFGLTQEAIGAARGIKFIPAMKDGRVVSQFVQIEYNFSLY